MSDNNLVDTHGKKFENEGTTATSSRAKERKIEDERYIPVIIKRSDDSVRHPDDILEHAIVEGMEQIHRPQVSLFLSAVAAGLILGFAAMSVTIMAQLFPMSDGPLMFRLMTAIVYPLGFVVCIMSGTQLFTEHTATAVYPILDGKSNIKSLMTVWMIVLAGNLTGTIASSMLLYLAEDVIGARTGFIMVADHLMHYSFFSVFCSAILAGWLMAQGGWLTLATSSTSTQVMSIFIVTFIIGLGGLHHSIVGSAEIFGGLLHADVPNFSGAMSFLVAAILGNLVGGSFFVGVLNYSHIRTGNK